MQKAFGSSPHHHHQDTTQKENTRWKCKKSGNFGGEGLNKNYFNRFFGVQSVGCPKMA
jgi:hypothetical protein